MKAVDSCGWALPATANEANTMRPSIRSLTCRRPQFWKCLDDVSALRHCRSPPTVPKDCLPAISTCPSFAPLRYHPVLQTSRRSNTATRTFSSSSALLKKGKTPPSDSKSPASAGKTATDDPFDTTQLDGEIRKATERLEQDLSKLRGGGRFNPELIEMLRVQLVKGSRETVRLRDVAQVVPKGRVVSVIVGEKEHIKPISTAISSSEHSLNPNQPTPEAPLTITVPLPPPTTESRQAVIASVGKATEVAYTAIRNARQAHHKRLRAMQLDRKVRPDDLRKASAIMEKTVEKGNGEVKRIAEKAKKALESH